MSLEDLMKSRNVMIGSHGKAMKMQKLFLPKKRRKKIDNYHFSQDCYYISPWHEMFSGYSFRDKRIVVLLDDRFIFSVSYRTK